MTICFTAEGTNTQLRESFEAEGAYSYEMLGTGWQVILNNF